MAESGCVTNIARQLVAQHSGTQETDSWNEASLASRTTKGRYVRLKEYRECAMYFPLSTTLHRAVEKRAPWGQNAVDGKKPSMAIRNV